MDRQTTCEYALRALSKAEMGEARVYYGTDILTVPALSNH